MQKQTDMKRRKNADYMREAIVEKYQLHTWPQTLQMDSSDRSGLCLLVGLSWGRTGRLSPDLGIPPTAHTGTTQHLSTYVQGPWPS